MFAIYNYFKFNIYYFYKKFNWIIFFFTYKRLSNFEYYNYKNEKINLNDPIYNFKSPKDISYNKNCLFVSSGDYNQIPTEIVNIKAFEYCKSRSFILIPRDKKLKKIFNNFGFRNLIYWDEYLCNIKYKNVYKIFKDLNNFEDIKNLKINNSNYGKYTYSTLIRNFNKLNFDLKDSKDSNNIIFNIYKSLIFHKSIEKIFSQINPDILFLTDNTYTPVGDLFDYAIDNNTEVIIFSLAHKNNSTAYKKYSKENRSTHPFALSKKTWSRLKDISWHEKYKNKVDKELTYSYSSNQWYSSQATAIKTKMFNPEELRKKLNINNNKKVAIIFPNIFWDATYFWGQHLFRDYEEWFLNTVKEACKNKEVQWFIKIHPSNMVKMSESKNFSEVCTIEENVGKLPDNIRFIYPNEGISTHSLFSISDYCVTVNGTVGIEASIQGVTTITSGKFRYDNLGFTIDSKTKKEYFLNLSKIEKIKSINNGQIRLAYKFAYATFIQKSIENKLVSYEYSKDYSLNSKNTFLFDFNYNLYDSFFFKKFALWLESDNSDFIN